MHHTPEQGALASIGRWTAIAVAAAILSACGGGGGNPGSTGSGAGTGGTGGTGGTPVAADPKINIAVTDASGANLTLLSGAQSATVKASVLTAAGKPAPGVIVQFSTSAASLLSFTPETASALTDANGVATVSVRPASVTSAGALSVTATSVVEGKTATASTNFTVGAAPLTVGALSFSPAPPSRLPAFSTASLVVPVTTGGQPASAAPGVTLTSLCVADGTATLVPGSFANGALSATYTNNGCLRGRDVITATIGSSVQTIGLDVDPANIGTIQFVGSSVTGSSIVLKGSGGQGRVEAAQISFRVVDQQGNSLPGVNVDFSATTNTGGLTVSPTRATTDAAGNVSTTVSSGTIPTPVRVTAEATRNGVRISGLSDTLTISTGLPIQKSMSMSAAKFNIEGLEYDSETTSITVLMADQYGNPVSDNTAINFVTEGGAIGSSAQGGCVTKDGGCSVNLRSQAFRPLDGRVTVLAYVQGIENFVDVNGDGQYSCSGYTGTTAYRPLVDNCPSGGEPFPVASTGQLGDMGDPFLDVDFNGVYDGTKGDLPFPYNSSSYKKDGDGKWGLNYIRRSFEVVFSGSHPRLIRQFWTGTAWRDWTSDDGDPLVLKGINGTACTDVDLRFRLTDVNNNPMPAETAVATDDVTNVTVGTVAPSKVPSTNALGGTYHSVNVKPNASCSAGSLGVSISTPRGIVTTYSFKYN
ncbi:Ig-like domain-containing protein [Massilia sp. IC2-477]|uniref:Ig-like domain-containing protein n=1 Tax=Massilia sp. IC2-477 TaxID=2887198 RepID=UPI001D116E0B|nr:Ig-like domain-containing protein [Massilia sp. IC2-477]MCC2957879.1 Ig-like domain-containing protein [Massilia sp. IC2-477]